MGKREPGALIAQTGEVLLELPLLGRTEVGQARIGGYHRNRELGAFLGEFDP
jgi:hypothetical protein